MAVRKKRGKTPAKKAAVRRRRPSTPVRAVRRRKKVSGFKSPIALTAGAVGAGSTYLDDVVKMLPIQIPYVKLLLVGLMALLTDTPKMREVNIALSTIFGIEVANVIRQKLRERKETNETNVDATIEGLLMTQGNQISGFDVDNYSDPQMVVSSSEQFM